MSTTFAVIQEAQAINQLNGKVKDLSKDILDELKLHLNNILPHLQKLEDEERQLEIRKNSEVINFNNVINKEIERIQKEIRINNITIDELEKSIVTKKIEHQFKGSDLSELERFTKEQNKLKIFNSNSYNNIEKLNKNKKVYQSPALSEVKTLLNHLYSVSRQIEEAFKVFKHKEYLDTFEGKELKSFDPEVAKEILNNMNNYRLKFTRIEVKEHYNCLTEPEFKNGVLQTSVVSDEKQINALTSTLQHTDCSKVLTGDGLKATIDNALRLVNMGSSYNYSYLSNRFSIITLEDLGVSYHPGHGCDYGPCSTLCSYIIQYIEL
jgi:hypothetical protein